MRNYLKLFIGISLFAFASCRKDTMVIMPEPDVTDHYSSMSNFFALNGVAKQEYTIDAVAGGSFTTPQGTVVVIPANAFVTQSNQPVTGNVTVQFKDIYKKSDMLLSNMPTMLIYGQPLKSGGEFFIKVSSGNSVVQLASGKKIDVTQPIVNTGVLDTTMQAFAILQDSIASGWNMSPSDSLFFNTTNYIFSMYQFTSPVDSGSWCNSDNQSFFSAYTQTLLTLHPTDSISTYNQQVFLVFQNISSMIHVYSNGTDFPYYYAPIGLPCTVVSIGIKDGKLYSSFVPITITTNQTVNFTLSETTTADFKAALEALN